MATVEEVHYGAMSDKLPRMHKPFPHALKLQTETMKNTQKQFEEYFDTLLTYFKVYGMYTMKRISRDRNGSKFRGKKPRT